MNAEGLAALIVAISGAGIAWAKHHRTRIKRAQGQSIIDSYETLIDTHREEIERITLRMEAAWNRADRLASYGAERENEHRQALQEVKECRERKAELEKKIALIEQRRLERRTPPTSQ